MKLKWWLIALRPFALPIFFLLTLSGFAMQYHYLNTDIFILSLGTVFMGIFAHLYNNYDDYRRGIDKLEGGSKEKPYTAASKILPSGKISPKSMLIASFISALIALIIGLYMLYKGYWTIIPAGIIGILLTLSYNMFEFKYKGLGGISFAGAAMSAIFIGAMMKTLYINWVVVLFAIYIGYVGFVFLNIDAYYDIEEDRKNGIVTFPMKHKRLFEYMAVSIIIIGAIYMIIMPILIESSWSFTLILDLLILYLGVSMRYALKSEKFAVHGVLAIILILIVIIVLSVS